jgi:hypothetical protein
MAEVPHGVLVPVENVLRKNGNEFTRRTVDFHVGFLPGVFCQVNHFKLASRQNVLLGDGNADCL